MEISMNVQENTVTIDLVELWYLFLFQWKKAFVFVLIGLILGGGFAELQYMRSSSDYSAYETAEEDYQTQKEQYENYISSNEESLSEYLDYYSNSILMQIDPQNEQRSYGTVRVTLSEGASQSDVNTAIQSRIFSDDFLKSLADDENTTEEYMKELISANTDDDGNLTITVKGLDSDFTQDVYSKIQDEISDVSRENRNDFVCVLPDPTTNTTEDDELMSRQSTYQNQISNARNAISNAQSSLDSLTEPQAPDSLKNLLVKYCAVGIILFLLLDLAFLLLRYVRRQPVYSEKSLPDVKLKNLGSYDQSQLYSRKYHGLKKFAAHKLGLTTGEDPTNTSAMVAVNLYNFTKDDLEKRKIVFLGEGPTDAAEQLMPDIEGELGNLREGYQLQYVKNVLTSPEARLTLGASDGAVILIRKGTTGWMTIREEERLLDELSLNCCGVIFL